MLAYFDLEQRKFKGMPCVEYTLDSRLNRKEVIPMVVTPLIVLWLK
jgi:LytS/YehU family sensor histidine kinase